MRVSVFSFAGAGRWDALYGKGGLLHNGRSGLQPNQRQNRRRNNLLLASHPF